MIGRSSIASARVISKRAQGTAGVNQRHQVLGVFAHGLLEQGQGFVEVVELPQPAGLLEFRNINAQARYDAGRTTRLGK